MSVPCTRKYRSSVMFVLLELTVFFHIFLFTPPQPPLYHHFMNTEATLKWANQFSKCSLTTEPVKHFWSQFSLAVSLQLLKRVTHNFPLFSIRSYRSLRLSLLQNYKSDLKMILPDYFHVTWPQLACKTKAQEQCSCRMKQLLHMFPRKFQNMLCLFK